MNNDYQYAFVLKNGHTSYDSLPILAIPGSYIYFSEQKYYVEEYSHPIDYPLGTQNDYDICVICKEVPNDVNIIQILRDIKINSIIK